MGGGSQSDPLGTRQTQQSAHPLQPRSLHEDERFHSAPGHRQHHRVPQAPLRGEAGAEDQDVDIGRIVQKRREEGQAHDSAGMPRTQGESREAGREVRGNGSESEEERRGKIVNPSLF